MYYYLSKSIKLYIYVSSPQGKMGPGGVKGVLGVKGPPVSNNY